MITLAISFVDFWVDIVHCTTNTGIKLLQRRYYERKIQALKKDHPKRWWNKIKDIAGVKVDCDSLQGLTRYKKLYLTSVYM